MIASVDSHVRGWMVCGRSNVLLCAVFPDLIWYLLCAADCHSHMKLLYVIWIIDFAPDLHLRTSPCLSSLLDTMTMQIQLRFSSVSEVFVGYFTFLMIQHLHIEFSFAFLI